MAIIDLAVSILHPLILRVIPKYCLIRLRIIILSIFPAIRQHKVANRGRFGFYPETNYSSVIPPEVCGYGIVRCLSAGWTNASDLPTDRGKYRESAHSRCYFLLASQLTQLDRGLQELVIVEMRDLLGKMGEPHWDFMPVLRDTYLNVGRGLLLPVP